MPGKLQRVNLTTEQKELLQKVSGVQILLRNSFNLNQKEIGELQEQAKQNAFIYLQRNQLGQKLSIFEENNLFTALVEIQNKLDLRKTPRRIECYDISHLSGKFVYGSMVTFLDGKPSKKLYKLFKTKEQNNDFENHKEVLRRRLERAFELEQKRAKNEFISTSENSWSLADLIIVDGGKGQLSSDLKVLKEYGEKFSQNNLKFEVEICALAKKEEEIFLPDRQISVIFQNSTKFLIQRIRDEAHRFAITNNQNARLRTASKSKLDDIAGIGPITKQKLLTTFGSTENVVDSLSKNPELLYELVGESVVKKLKKTFGFAV